MNLLKSRYLMRLDQLAGLEPGWARRAGLGSLSSRRWHPHEPLRTTAYMWATVGKLWAREPHSLSRSSSARQYGSP